MSPEGVFEHGQVRVLEFEAPRMVGNNQFENRSKTIGFFGAVWYFGMRIGGHMCLTLRCEHIDLRQFTESAN